jgi:hypothetical protein
MRATTTDPRRRRRPHTPTPTPTPTAPPYLYAAGMRRTSTCTRRGGHGSGAWREREMYVCTVLGEPAIGRVGKVAWGCRWELACRSIWKDGGRIVVRWKENFFFWPRWDRDLLHGAGLGIVGFAWGFWGGLATRTAGVGGDERTRSWPSSPSLDVTR